MSLTDTHYEDCNPISGNTLYGVFSFCVDVVLLLLWAIILVFGAAVYLLHHEGNSLARYVEKKIVEEIPGLSCTIRSIEPVLRNGPGIRLTDLLLRNGKGDVLYADACDLTPNPTALLHGRLSLASLTLHNPLIRMKEPLSVVTRDTAVSAAVPRDNAFPSELAGTRLTIRNGTVLLNRGDKVLSASGLSFNLVLPSSDDDGITFPDTVVRAETLGYHASTPARNAGPEQPETLLAVQRVQLKTADVRLSETGIPIGRFSLEGEGRVGETSCRLHLDCTMHVKDGSVLPTLEGRLDARGLVPIRPGLPKSNPNPRPSETTSEQKDLLFDLSAVFVSDDVQKGVVLQNAVVQLPNRTHEQVEPLAETPAADAATIKGRITFQPTFQFQGTVQVHRFSPNRWFDSIQAMPTELRQSLDRLQGELNVVLTPEYLDIPELHIDAAGTRFQGTGGIADFRRPVIRLEASTSDIRLDPFLSVSSDGPLPDIPPVSVTSGSHATPGYDIRLAAKTVAFRKISGSGLNIRLQPHSGGTKLNISLQHFYGGTIKANLNLGESTEIDFRIADVQTEKLIHAASGSDFVTGRLDAEGSLHIPKTGAARHPADVSGSVRLGIRNGTYRFGGKTETFSRLELRFAGKGTKKNRNGREPLLIGDGLWQAALHRPKLNIHLDLDGPVCFSPSLIPVRIDTAALRAGGAIGSNGAELKGSLEYDAVHRRLRMDGIKGRWGGLTLSGHLTGLGVGRAPVWQGECDVQTSDLRGLLRLVNLLPDGMGPDVLHKAAVKTRFSVSDKEQRLEDMVGNIDGIAFRGTLIRRTGMPPSWETNLAVEELNMDRYLPQKPPSPSDTPWPVDVLETFALKGHMRVAALTLSGITLHAVELPVRVHQGLLTIDRASARVCGGDAGARLRCRTSGKGFVVRLVCALRNTDMRRLTSSQGEGGTTLSGKGDLDADIQGNLRSSFDIPSRLNGSWAIKINKGHFAEKDGTRRFFSLIAASGTLRNGVLHSDDLRVSGNDFSLHGKGHVNLVNRTLGYDLNVSAMGLRNIPVRYSGSLSEPQRRISAVGIVTGTLGLMGRGVFGLVNGVLGETRRLLRR